MLHQHSPRVLVFDSGIGGMGVVRALREKAPSLRVDYLADNALFPYGEQPDGLLIDRVVTLLDDACQRLTPDMIIIACNTASTLALPAVRAVLDRPVVGCVPPIRWAGRVSTTRTIGLLATTATARRPYVTDLHQRFANDCRLIVHGSKALAQLAERAFRGEACATEAVTHEVNQLFKQPGGEEIDTIGLGCTHYTFLMPAFRQLHQRVITWLDPAPAVAQYALQRLAENYILPPALEACEQKFLVTQAPQNPEELVHHISRLGFQGWALFQAPPSGQLTQRTRLTV